MSVLSEARFDQVVYEVEVLSCLVEDIRILESSNQVSIILFDKVVGTGDLEVVMMFRTTASGGLVYER